MSFHNVSLPQNYSYATRKGLVAINTKFASDSRDKTIVPLKYVYFKYDLLYKARTPEQLAELRRFYLNRQGGLYGFKFTDLDDFSSAPDGVSTPTMTDQVIYEETPGHYRLAKTYVLSKRLITRPYNVIISDNGVDVTSSCTIQANTGKITGYTPTGPAGTFKAGFNFYVPVIFDGGFYPKGGTIESDVNLTIEELL